MTNNILCINKSYKGFEKIIMVDNTEVLKSLNTGAEALKQLRTEILSGEHKQFVFNKNKERVECRCGHAAVFWKTGYICGTITAYPCKYNKL